MKRALLLIILAGAVSYGVARWTIISRQAPSMISIHDPVWLTRELKLNDEQSREVEKLEAEFARQLNSACATHCSARIALGNALMKPDFDAAQSRACIEKMNAVQADSERATLEHILQVRALLNEQQARQYSVLIQKQVCDMPMGAY